MVAVISNYFSVHEQGQKNWSKHNVHFWWRGTGWKLILSHKKRALYHRVAERALNKSSLLCFDFCVKLRLCYSINDDVTLRFFWFKFTIFYRTRNDTNLTRHGVLAEFLFGIFIVVASVLIFSSDMVCLQRFFVFVLFIFFSKLY